VDPLAPTAPQRRPSLSRPQLQPTIPPPSLPILNLTPLPESRPIPHSISLMHLNHSLLPPLQSLPRPFTLLNHLGRQQSLPIIRSRTRKNRVVVYQRYVTRSMGR
jgi:hypothetical protein